MAATASDFRGAFPAFKDTAKFPDPQVAFYLALGYKLNDADRFGDVLDFAVQLWAAHNLSLDYESARQAAAGQNPGAVRGPVTGMSANGVSWQRDAGSAMDPGAGHWNLTVYGVRYLGLLRLFGAGPVQVGVPSEAEIAASAGYPWPAVT